MTNGEKLAARPFERGDMYSTAFQFYSYIKGSVDPRTGMYGANIELSTGEGNRLRGPGFPFRLSYSALDEADDGFGPGWRLGLSELILGSNETLLSLAEGETHKVILQGLGNEARFPDRKLRSCSLVPTAGGPDKATIRHVTGMIEYLEKPIPSSQVLRPVRIAQANGDAIHLAWELHNGVACLMSVTDDEGDVLLQATYTANDATLSIPLGGEKPMEMVFIRERGQLRRVSLPTLSRLNGRRVTADDEAEWKFDYEISDDGALQLLSSITSPDGIEEAVTYQQNGLRLPDGAPRQFMPCVSSRTRRSAGVGGAVLDRSEYDFETHNLNNFYGYGEVNTWENRSDQLLYLRGDYDYGSKETLFDAERRKLYTVERTYNHFHLIRSETTSRGNVVHRVDTTYGDEPNTPFDQQPENFQLPRRVQTSRYANDAPSIKWVTYVENQYDDMGNILSHFDSATGITEVSAYYPVEGETTPEGVELCPPDPLGVVRRLKSMTTRPGPLGGHVRSTRYAYNALPLAKAPHDPADPGVFVQCTAETLVHGEASSTEVLVHDERQYITDGGFQHGSLRQERHEQDGSVDVVDHTYVNGEDGSITAVDTHTTHDGIVNTTQQTRQRISGLISRNVDERGNITEFFYDDLARTIRQEIAPDDDEYHATVTWSYTLSLTERSVTRKGITGLEHTLWMDEHARPVRQRETLPDGSQRDVLEMTYDALGQLVSEVRHDHFNDPSQSDLRMETRYAYDDWGQCARQTAPDGSHTVRETSLTTLPGGETATAALQWQEYDAKRTAWLRTTTNAAGQQVLLERGTWDNGVPGEVQSTQRWSYDGLGRCNEMTDARGHVTGQAWDVHDRLSETTLPDGTVIHRTFAPGHEDELVATLSITPEDETNPRVLGRRTWDGLGRLVSEEAGSLRYQQAYVEKQASPATRTMPGGGVIEMNYDRRLDEVLNSSRLAPTRTDGSAITGSRAMTDAVYDKKLGLPTSVRADGGTLTIQPDSLGRMTRQVMALDGDVERRFDVNVSLGGRERRKSGVDGVTQTYGYDRQGRLDHVSDDDIDVILAYDGLSRLSERRTLSKADLRTLYENRSYDDYGRIASIQWTYAGEPSYGRSLWLTWGVDDKLEGRLWRHADGTSARSETMEYDNRGRLTRHAIQASNEDELPKDEMGKPYVEQVFKYDYLDNIESVSTVFARDGENTTVYGYDATDLDRLISVYNTALEYPGHDTPLLLKYDANGNLIDDGMGRTLQWDDAGRLVSIEVTDKEGITTTTTYVHGPDGRVSSVTHGPQTTYRYRDDGMIAYEHTRGPDEGRRFLRTPGGIVAETRLAGTLRETLLLSTDPQGSVVIESAPGADGAP